MRLLSFLLIGLLFCMTACAMTDTPVKTMPGTTITADNTPESTPIPVSSPPRHETDLPAILSGITFSAHVEPLSLDDMALGAITVNFTPDDVKKELGEPTDITENDQYAIGTAMTYTYPFGEVVFVDQEESFFLHDFGVTSGEWETPRGISIGSSLQDLITAYVDQIDTINEDNAIFFRYNSGSDSDVVIPPSGQMWGDGGQWFVNFSIPIAPEQHERYTLEELEEGIYTYYYYTLSFTVQDDTVSKISLFTGPFGE